MFGSMMVLAAAAISAQSGEAAKAPDASAFPPELFERSVPPRGEMAGLFRGDDYPHEAIVRNEQGTTRVALLIDESGRVTECHVEVSSGSSALDAKTCEVLASRAQFEPARDEAGRAVASAVRERIRWVMMESVTVRKVPEPAVQPRLLNIEEVITPDDYPDVAVLKEEQGRAVAGVVVDETGRVAGCSIFSSSGSAALDAQTCKLLTERAKFEPARDAQGLPIAAAVAQPVRWVLEGEQIINPTTAWSERIITRFSPAGAPIGCEIEIVGIDLDPDEPLECDVEHLGTEGSVPTVSGLPSAIGAATYEVRFIPGEEIASDLVRGDPGDTLIMRRYVRVKIGADGRVVDCGETGWDGLAEPPPGACEMVPSLFEPFRNEAGEAVPGQGTMIFSLYARTEVIS